ncbi:phospholipase A2 [Pochonia chlamydosporia 170]|uniref:Phospholipase A2 n=1 Tax=Pochonia chlamydosporia 170 TaxID=1380566 RepID=A0A179EWW2_METCM|nr:phospholipase A2 [Pochonia chlamydosporia 170]OAQ57674.1 phospholipase A2 [Pochonia chlamydosporia 170]
MKPVFFISALATCVSATPSSTPSAEIVTDELLFNVTLPEFIACRDAKNPSSLDWSSDSCSKSPDNPFKFPFDHGCKRHDFGYRNYKAQSRFTRDNRKRIDLNFFSDLTSLCEAVEANGACRGLANVYYYGVRLFGGQGQTRSIEAEEEDLYRKYVEAQEEYKQLVKEAQAKGKLPILR